MSQQDFYNLIFAILMGAAIGMQREHTQLQNDDAEKKSFGGIRTFALGSILGFLGMYFVTLKIEIFLPLSFIALIGLLIISYYKDKQGLGLTSEVAFLITFAIGSLCAMGSLYTSAFLMVITVGILGAKKPVRKWLSSVTDSELNNATKFAIISLVMLPLLPNTIPISDQIKTTLAYIPLTIVNPKEIWWVVVLVSGIGFVGYLLSRIWGSKRGLLLTAFSGGLVSSTAVTMNYSKQSQQSREPIYLAIGILLACLIMFPRMLIEAAIFSMPMAQALLLPFAAIFAVGLIYIFFLYRRRSHSDADEVEVSLQNPLSLKDGIIFGLLYLGVQIFAWYGEQYMGNWGLYSVALISGLTDVDAITINMAKSSAKGLDLSVATMTAYLAAVSNTVTKAIYVVLLAPRSFAKKALPGFALMLIAGFLFLLF